MKGKRSEDGKQGSTEIKQMDLYAMTRKFRLDPKRLRYCLTQPKLKILTFFYLSSKQKRYQILHFPMTAPLTDYEKNSRKEVRSTQIL
jgi:hypothetical protein